MLDPVPDKLVIGTGSSGMMKISVGVLELCKNCGIEVEAYQTAEAVEQFNDAVEAGTAVAACFHLTC